MIIGFQQRCRAGFRGGIVAALLVFWALSSVAICVASTRAEAEAMACCQPADCEMSAMSAQHPCCALQSNPSQPSANPVVPAGHFADRIATVVTPAQHKAGATSTSALAAIPPDAPPGCNSILRI